MWPMTRAKALLCVSFSYFVLTCSLNYFTAHLAIKIKPRRERAGRPPLNEPRTIRLVIYLTEREARELDAIRGVARRVDFARNLIVG